MTTTLPNNQVYINAQPSLLQQLYGQAPADRITNGLVQVGIVVIFSNNNPPASAPIYTNVQGQIVNDSGTPINQLSFGSSTDTFVGGKAFVALSGTLDWATANAFKNSSGTYDEALFSFENALFYQVQLDSFEFTFNNGPFDGANLTSVNWFGIPMRMWVPGNTSSGNQSGFLASPDQKNWVAALSSIGNDGKNVFKDADGNFLIAASPTTSTFSNQSYPWQLLPDVDGTTFTVAENLNYYPNQIVKFSAESGGTLPQPLQTNTNYYVVSYDSSSGDLTVSDTPGGSPITFTSIGSDPANLSITITTADYPKAAYGNFDTYVNDFVSWLPTLTQGTQPTGSDYSISGYFNGAPSDDAGQKIWHNSGFYNYQIYYDSTKENIVLIPGSQITDAGVSQVQGIIAISKSELENSIIATNGSYSVYESLTDYFNNTPYNYVTNFPTGTTAKSATTINTGSNNQWGPVFANLATGFVAGYWRENNTSANTALFNNSNFWSYFQANGTPKAFSDTTAGFFDPYSKLFAQNSNSYGGNYTDNLTKSLTLGGPLLTVGTGNNDDNSIYVSLLDINNLPSTSQTPPSNDVATSFADFTWNGYQVPIQLAPSELTPSTFSTKPSLQNSSLSVAIDFSGQMITLDSDQITSFSLKSSDGNFIGQIEKYSGAGNYQLVLENGIQTLNYSPADQPEGFFQLVQLPLPIAPTREKLITEYTLDFLDKAETAIYTAKFYLTTDDAGKALAQNQAKKPNNLAVYTSGYTQTLDGQYLSTLKLSPINPGLTQLPPPIWDYNSSILSETTFNQPWAPVVWTQNTQDKEKITYVISSDTLPNQDYTVSTPLISGEVIFSWLGGPNTLTGAPHYTLPDSFISNLSAYTNKTFASTSGKVQFVKPPNGLTPLQFEADIDGQWAVSTNPVTPLTNGTYTVSMTQALTDAQGNSIPVGYAGGSTSSFSTTFTVNSPTLSLQAPSQGLTVQPPTGVTGGGQWMNVIIDSWKESENSTFILYATNAAGQLISRDQTQVGGNVSLADATLAQIGVIVTDNGTLLQEGQASVYLRSDQFLRVAVVAGDGSVIEDLPVSNTVFDNEQQDKAVLTTEDFTFIGQLVDNLNPTDWLAHAQFQQNEPIYFFQANSTIQVAASGSCALTNTLKWAPVTFDPLTGQKMVGGVVATDTDEFRDSLKKNALDFSITGTGQQFNETQELKIATEGYYAPFLETSAGNTFFIGTVANPNDQAHFRLFGNGVFGVEDLPGANSGDFDFNDIVVRLTPI